QRELRHGPHDLVRRGCSSRRAVAGRHEDQPLPGADVKHRIVRIQGQRIAWTASQGIDQAGGVAAIKVVAAESKLDRVVVHFKRSCGGASGWAYQRIPKVANLDGLKRYQWDYLIIVAVRGRMTPRNVNTLAHEAKHIDQYRHPALYRQA